MTLRVGVVGAAGRMGSEVCRTVLAEADLELVAAVDPSAVGQPLRDVGVASDLVIAGGLEALTAADTDVAVDFTAPTVVAGNVTWYLDHGIHGVVGTTGMGDEDQARLSDRAATAEANVVLAPNFALGAVLLMQFARQAARFLPHAEVVELHHDRKADAPSGTALRTADLIAAARTTTPEPVMGETHPGARGADRAGVRVHAVRLPGLVAHQEVIFGGTGQTLTLRHDSIDRSSFMPGVVLAVRSVASVDGMVVGLEHLLD